MKINWLWLVQWFFKKGRHGGHAISVTPQQAEEIRSGNIFRDNLEDIIDTQTAPHQIIDQLLNKPMDQEAITVLKDAVSLKIFTVQDEIVVLSH